MRNRLNKLAKTLRKTPTKAEFVLWNYLKAKQLNGLKFRRQEPIGNYIADFACYENKLIIEVDGGQHAVDKEADSQRDFWLKEQGFRVLRFWNNDVLTNIEGAWETIKLNV